MAFELVGWSTTLLCGYLAWRHGWKFFRPANGLYDWTKIPDGPTRLGYLFCLDLAVYTPPQVLLAWMGGRLASRQWPGTPSQGK